MHHLKKVWIISDEKWVHDNNLLLGTFEILNFHCLTHSAVTIKGRPRAARAAKTKYRYIFTMEEDDHEYIWGLWQQLILSCWEFYASVGEKLSISSDDKWYLRSKVKTIHFVPMHFLCAQNMHTDMSHSEIWKAHKGDKCTMYKYQTPCYHLI